MPRSQQVMDDTVAQRIVASAVRCIYERGFAATTIREIAAAAGVPCTRIYEHHGSKQALLEEIIAAAHDGLLAQTVSAVSDAGQDPVARLDAALWAMSDFHARHTRASSVAQSELRTASFETRRRALETRRRLQDLCTEIIREGALQGCFAVNDPTASSRALLTMVAAIPTWYDPDGLEPPRRVARNYCDMGARMVGVHLAALAPSVVALGNAS